MLYCPGSGQELLSAFGVTMECHDSSVFLIRKLPLSITEALLKSMGWSWDHAWFAILAFAILNRGIPWSLQMQTTILAHSLGNTTFFLHTFITNLHSPFFFFFLFYFYSYTFIFIFRYSLLPVEDCRSSSRKLVIFKYF